MSLLDTTMGRSHSEAQLPVLASANLEAKMNLLLQPWYLLVVLLSEWLRQQQEKVIEFQKAQIEILMKELGPQRIPKTAVVVGRLPEGPLGHSQ